MFKNILRLRSKVSLVKSSADICCRSKFSANQWPWFLNRTRTVHSSAAVSAKLFVDRENHHAHEVLAQSLKPYKLFRLATDAEMGINEKKIPNEIPSYVLEPPSESSASVDEVFDNFCALARYCILTDTTISDERYERFSKLFCDVSHKFSDEQLLEALRQIAIMPPAASVKDRNFMDIWNKLDMMCCQRLEDWDTDRVLLMCDAWYTLHLARISSFVWEALQRLSRKLVKMRPEQLVHTMFFCNVMRRPIYDMFNFEVNLARCAESMSLEELGVMSMGFFKTQTPIHNPKLLEHLYRRLMAEADKVEDITLVAILKVLRYSTKLGQADLMMELLEKLRYQVDRLSILSCLHIALLGSGIQCCHDEILENVLQRFNRDIDETRLKDLERICFAIGVFNYRSPSGVDEELSEKILHGLNSKIDEITKYPRCFANCLHYLSLRNHYDTEMISSALDKRFIHHGYGKNMAVARELFHLDAFVRINLEDESYEGHLLTDKQRKSMAKVLTHYIPERNPKYKLNTTDRILMEIKETTERIFRDCTFKHILPHFERPDVVLCYDRETHKAIPLSKECPEDYSGVILGREQLLGHLSDNKHIETVALVVAGWNNVVRGKDRHTGLFDMKLKQLSLLGHKQILIYWHDWRDLETQTDRQNYIKRRLSTVIPI